MGVSSVSERASSIESARPVRRASTSSSVATSSSVPSTASSSAHSKANFYQGCLPLHWICGIFAGSTPPEQVYLIDFIDNLSSIADFMK